jgi:hypothetical protein
MGKLGKIRNKKKSWSHLTKLSMRERLRATSQLYKNKAYGAS